MDETLMRDVGGLEGRIADERFCAELYRALANGVWRKQGAVVSPSSGEAERIVNELRGRHGHEPLDLAAGGGEGEVSELVATELERLGWSHEPLDTDRHVPEHETRDEASPPPRGTGARLSPEDEPGRWEREARDEADENRSTVHPEQTTER